MRTLDQIYTHDPPLAKGQYRMNFEKTKVIELLTPFVHKVPHKLPSGGLTHIDHKGWACRDVLAGTEFNVYDDDIDLNTVLTEMEVLAWAAK